MHTYIIHTTS